MDKNDQKTESPVSIETHVNSDDLEIENPDLVDIATLTELENASVHITEDTIFTLADVYWETRAQRRLVQKTKNDQVPSRDRRVLEYFEKNFLKMENAFKKAVKSYCQDFEVGRWALNQYGVGPLSVVRLLRYVDVKKTRSHEQLWAYAGLAPKSGPNQTYNSSLKETCIDLGRSFIRHSDKEDCFYGQLFNEELERRTELNENGAYADLVKEELVVAGTRIIKDQPEKLTVDRLRAQAQRYAVKIFLVHWYTLDYKDTYGHEYSTNNKNIVPIPVV